MVPRYKRKNDVHRPGCHEERRPTISCGRLMYPSYIPVTSKPYLFSRCNFGTLEATPYIRHTISAQCPSEHPDSFDHQPCLGWTKYSSIFKNNQRVTYLSSSNLMVRLQKNRSCHAIGIPVND